MIFCVIFLSKKTSQLIGSFLMSNQTKIGVMSQDFF